MTYVVTRVAKGTIMKKGNDVVKAIFTTSDDRSFWTLLAAKIKQAVSRKKSKITELEQKTAPSSQAQAQRAGPQRREHAQHAARAAAPERTDTHGGGRAERRSPEI